MSLIPASTTTLFLLTLFLLKHVAAEIQRSMLRPKLLLNNSAEASAEAEADKIASIRLQQKLRLVHLSIGQDRSFGRKPKLRQHTEAGDKVTVVEYSKILTIKLDHVNGVEYYDRTIPVFDFSATTWAVTADEGSFG